MSSNGEYVLLLPLKEKFVSKFLLRQNTKKGFFAKRKNLSWIMLSDPT